MSLTIVQIPAGPIETNAYLVMDTESRDAMLVDTPPDVSSLALHAAEDIGANVTRIVITHGHWDHIVGAAAVQENWDVPISAHEKVRNRLEDAAASPTSPIAMIPVNLDNTIDEGDEVTVGEYSFDVMYMPGHDEGHIILYCKEENVILGGDVLFPDGHGRTDIPGSDQQVMNQTLKRFLDLPAETIVYPGHGDSTTVGREQRWIRDIQ